jgi:glycosyltransferase involved in cell wall biosynthesis
VAEPLRVLVAGWLNSPHVISWAETVAMAGHEVHLVGRAPPGRPAEGANAKVYPLPGEGPPLVRSLRMSRALARVAAEVDPDLVHAHWLPEFGWMAAREGLHPLVCSAWGSDVYGVRGIGRRRSKRALDGSQLVLADSVHLAGATRRLADRDVRVEVVRWGLDLERFSPGDTSAARRALGLEHDGPLVVSVRGFEPVYNPELQIEAFARVRRRRADARLLLKHPVEKVPPTVRRSIERLGLGDAVTIVGNVPLERMPDVYRAADVVLSVPSSDSSPRSVWEALACGRPVVASDLPWAREELEPDRQASLVPLDAVEIAGAISRVLDDGRLGERLGEEARALAVAELDPRTCAARIDAIYRSVVGSAR